MKKIYLTIIAASLLLAGCAKIDDAERLDVVPEGEMRVQLGLNGPFGDAVRSYVSGTESAVSSVKMLCFNSDGQYIMTRDAVVSASSATQGTLTGSVPSNTSRIHFVANYPTLDASSFVIGSNEQTIMKSAPLSSGVTDEIRFWGYHREASREAMQAWLVGGNTVQLVRDRAKVILSMNLNAGADPITSLQWTVVNGVNRGYIAAVSASGSHPYDNNYTTGNRITEYTSSGKYASLEDAPAIWAAAGEPQYLFECTNNTSDPLKIIIRAAYSDGFVRYHTLLFQDDSGVLYDVHRNDIFRLTVKSLPKALGVADYSAAVASTDYSNNAYATVSRMVDEVSNDQFTLKVGTVSEVFTENESVVIHFTYTARGTGSISGLSGSSFTATWEPKSETDTDPDAVAEVGGDLAAPTVTFDPSTGAGTITFPLAEITSQLKHNTLQLVAKNSGLARYVEIYSITRFDFVADPVLVNNGTTRVVAGVARDVYKLTFTLPDNIPASEFPLNVRAYSSSLEPFSDADPLHHNGVFVDFLGDTSDLAPVEPVETGVWNYGFKSWGGGYDYIIEALAPGGAYTFYLADISGNFSREFTSVGLYLLIDDFGGAIPLHVDK